MRSITLFLEGRERTNFDSVSLISSEIAQYRKKMEKQMSEDAKKALFLLEKYNILNKIDVEAIRTATKSKFKNLAKQFNCQLNDIEDLNKILKSLGKDIRMLPMYQTESERKELEAGRLAMNDVTMDLETEQGKSAVAKQYGPLVMRIVNQFVGKSSLSKDELISAGMYGLAYAINTFQKPTEKLEDTFKNTEKKEIEAGKETKSQSFKSWASWCIRNKILDDINNLSRTVKVDAYHQGLLKKAGEDIPTSHSIEALGSDKDGEEGGMMDRIMQLSTSDDRAGEGEESQKWNILFKSLEKKLPKRDVSIFYKLFGLNGEQVTKGKDIASEFGISQAAVTTAKNKVLSFLQNNKDLRDILLDILNIYTESLMSKVWNKSQDDILEALRNDNTYILLEELNRWSNPKVLESAINTVLYKSSDFTKEDTIFITDCLTAENERFITENFKKQRRVLVTFLESMYPQETFARKSDGYICEKMEEFRKLIEEYKIVL